MQNKILKISVILFLTCYYNIAFSQDNSVAPPIKTFATQPNQAGAANNTVNLFTGDVALPINLISIPGHNGLNMNVSIAYSSNVQNIVNTWNAEAPTGVIGLGWSMNTAKILRDNKQTGTNSDDEYYLTEGGNSSRLIRTSSGRDANGNYLIYETKNYAFWKIKYYSNEFSCYSCPERWEIIREDGTKYIYGDRNSNRNTIQWIVVWDNWIGNSSLTENQNQMANAWNLSEIINLWGEKITFEYEIAENYVGSISGKKQTEASYLRYITDPLGRKISFIYTDQSAYTYFEPHTEQPEPDAYQEFYEKKYLSSILVSRENNLGVLFSIIFQYGTSNFINTQNCDKLVLTGILQKNSNGNSLPPMLFDYYTSNNLKGFLKTVTYPTGGTVTYNYNAAGLSIGHSNRQLTINAPAGYAEPKTWIGEDYVVVAWRELGSGATHDNNSRNVKLYVYQWVGEWKEQFFADHWWNFFRRTSISC